MGEREILDAKAIDDVVEFKLVYCGKLIKHYFSQKRVGLIKIGGHGIMVSALSRRFQRVC